MQNVQSTFSWSKIAIIEDNDVEFDPDRMEELREVLYTNCSEQDAQKFLAEVMELHVPCDSEATIALQDVVPPWETAVQLAKSQ